MPSPSQSLKPVAWRISSDRNSIASVTDSKARADSLRKYPHAVIEPLVRLSDVEALSRPTPPEAQAGADICSQCQGSGEQQFMTQHLGPNDYEVTGQCSKCGGTGVPQSRQASAEGAPTPTHAELLALGADCADTLLAIGRRIGFGRAQQILGEQWDAEFGCAPRGSMGVTVKDVEALRVAVDHIDMAALEISHCKDAAIIREALVGIGRPPKKRGYMGSTVDGGFDDHDDAALAAPKAVAQGWRPITDADKDGSSFLVNDTTGLYAPYCMANWLQGEEWQGWVYDDEMCNDGNPLGPQPTHCMRISSPSEEKKA